jgi:GDSL-like Lipase/Acylhydrolase family
MANFMNSSSKSSSRTASAATKKKHQGSKHSINIITRPRKNATCTVFGDSIIRQAAAEDDLSSVCMPGASIQDIKVQIPRQKGSLLATDTIIIHCGTNDLSNGATTQDIVKGLQEVVDLGKSELANAKLYVSGILRRGDKTRESILAINKDIEKMCAASGVKFIEPNTVIGDKSFAPDGLHLNYEGHGELRKFFRESTKAEN